MDNTIGTLLIVLLVIGLLLASGLLGAKIGRMFSRVEHAPAKPAPAPAEKKDEPTVKLPLKLVVGGKPAKSNVIRLDSRRKRGPPRSGPGAA